MISTCYGRPDRLAGLRALFDLALHALRARRKRGARGGGALPRAPQGGGAHGLAVHHRTAGAFFARSSSGAPSSGDLSSGGPSFGGPATARSETARALFTRPSSAHPRATLPSLATHGARGAP